MVDYKQFIEENRDVGYKAFQEKLLPGTDAFLGVRLPLLRQLARRISKESPLEFLALQAFDSYEEKMLHGFVIGSLQLPFEEVMVYVKNFIPVIDNWGICDSFCSSLKITKNHKAEMWAFLESVALEKEEFSQRFVVVMLLNYYMETAYLDKVLQRLGDTRHDGYYVKMAVAWAISIAFIHEPEKTAVLINSGKLEEWTRKKAIQKIKESRRVQKEKWSILV